MIIDVLVGHEIFKELRCFVVKTMELGAETSSLEKTKNLFVIILDGFLLAIGYGLSMNGVAVVVVKDEDVVVAVD